MVVARLADGTWSAPSGIATGGAGFGGQIGFELTDFVFILNDYAAVKTFSQQGSITLGGNVSIAAGPVGRNAEAAGAASLKGVSGIFAYSKTKGLFAGVSIEGSVLIERRDANEKLYGSQVTARQLLEGGIRPPSEAEPLMRVLNSRIFAGVAGNTDIYNDIPVYDDDYDSYSRTTNRNSRTPTTAHAAAAEDDYEYKDSPQRSSTFGTTSPTRANPRETFDSIGRRGTLGSDNKPARPTAPKPAFQGKSSGSLGPNEAEAIFTFEAAQAGDLGFKKGDRIHIIKRTDNETDWWTGRIGTREGIFPRYVSLPIQCHYRSMVKSLTRLQQLHTNSIIHTNLPSIDISSGAEGKGKGKGVQSKIDRI